MPSLFTNIPTQHPKDLLLFSLMENWKPVANYEEYDVSDCGNVRRKGRLLKPWIINSGYYVVSLCKNSKKSNFTVHSLVANAFLEKTNSEIDHVDRNKLNNNVSNLRWVRRAENNWNTGWRSTNTGLKHINVTDAGNYRVCIQRKNCTLHWTKTFKQLQDAISYRDKIIKEYSDATS